MTPAVVIDCFPESAAKYRNGYAVVAIDVIRATTTATTAVSTGRRGFPARTTDEAVVIADSLQEALLVGELGVYAPFGFEMTNSPAQIADRADTHRPMVLVSSSGTQLIMNAAEATQRAVYLACLRNYSAVADYLAARHPRVAVLGAGTRGQFRREDQIGCALVAQALIERGFAPDSEQTVDCLARWREATPEAIRTTIVEGRSAAYLRTSGQEADLAFVLAHLDDLDTVPALVDGELVDLAKRPRAVLRLQRGAVAS